MRKFWFLSVLSVLGFWLVACQPQEPAVLPTAINIAQVQTLNAPTITPTSLRPTLPPTFTITPTEIPPTQTPIPEATFSVMGEATEVPESQGTIYYVYNNDSIIALSADGLSSTLVMTFGVDRRISDLVASPDGQFIAFVASPDGVRSEVYIMNRDGSYLQPISCLGFQNVQLPTWTSEGSALSWFASPRVGEAGNIYYATVAGSGNCPNANGQRVLIPLNEVDFFGMAWNLTNERIFYSQTGGIWQYNLSTQARSEVVSFTGFAPSTFPKINRSGEMIAFEGLRLELGEVGYGLVFVADTNTDTPELLRNFAVGVVFTSASWSEDGETVLLVAEDNLYYLSEDLTRIEILNLSVDNSLAILSPDGQTIAFTRNDRRGVPQWFVFNVFDETEQGITRNPEGVISFPIWVR
jgi:Tol biopolymer transport system component